TRPTTQIQPGLFGGGRRAQDAFAGIKQVDLLRAVGPQPTTRSGWPSRSASTAWSGNGSRSAASPPGTSSTEVLLACPPSMR
ncbi:MAG: hypothetical protein M3Z04_14665, partial [Chloroflexota bacterium]|nr:hypothetical protein [Chloroflexota bacterium]